MIRPGSRYAPAFGSTPGGDPVTPADLPRRSHTVPAGGVEHVVSQGERLDQLATVYYGDPSEWWRILDANAVPLNPFELLRPGRRLRIPPRTLMPS
jgi:nucleoid-associated protein YgaU